MESKIACEEKAPWQSIRESALVTHGTFLGPAKFKASLHEVFTCLSTPKLVLRQETFIPCPASQQTSKPAS